MANIHWFLIPNTQKGKRVCFFAFFSCANLCTWFICFDRKKYSIKFWIFVFFVSLQSQNGNNLLLGYGVMVTLQILVLSFLVRVQIAQQKKRTSHRFRLWGVLFFIRPFQILWRYRVVPEYAEGMLAILLRLMPKNSSFPYLLRVKAVLACRFLYELYFIFVYLISSLSLYFRFSPAMPQMKV